MRTIAITPPATLPYEHEWAAALLGAGLYRLHVRKPDFTEREMAGYLSPLVELGLGLRLALHSHYSLAARFGIPHLHITGRSRGLPLPAECCECTLSTSIHTLREVLDLRSTPYRYAFLSPVRPSLSKQGYMPTLTDAELMRALAASPIPLVALGGVTGRNIAELRALGFRAVAAIGAFWHAETLERAMATLQVLCKA